MSIKSTMQREHQPRSGMALGGLGTGSIELRHDGIFYNWSIFNNVPLALGPRCPLLHSSLLFFLVRYQEAGGPPQMRLLQIEESHDAAALEHHQHHYVFPWLDGIDRIDAEVSFPFTRLKFNDAGMPFTVELEAWSPFIPHDAKNSALPTAVFDFKITSKTNKPVDVLLLASVRNAVGYDVATRTYVSRLHESATSKTVELTCDGLPVEHATNGSLGLLSLAGDTTHYLGWEHPHPYYEIVLRSKKLPNVDDTEGRNPVDKTTGQRQAMKRCFSTLGVSRQLNARQGSFAHTFALTWCFPNRYAESSHTRWPAPHQPADHIEGHYYDNFFHSAAEVATYVQENRAELYRRSRAFHAAFFDSTAPRFVLDQINSQLNTLITSSWFTKAGYFGVIEGMDPEQNYAGLNTMDVMMYGGVTVSALFPELDRYAMRAFARFQGADGRVAHSITRNLRELLPSETTSLRLDMPMQFAYLSLRAAEWSGDTAFLAEVWPAVKRALEYCLRERDKNHDGMPDMEGIMCTYDNFPMHGVASYLGSQWLAAIALTVRTAEKLGDTDAAERYRKVFTQAKQVFEAEAWNGKYYRLWKDGAKKDEGCLTDQIIGQWAAHLAGLERVVEPRRAQAALRHVMKVNYWPEQGLRNCSWPGDKYLHDVDKDTWVDQANTCWTGVELAFASLLLYEGLATEALNVIRNVDERYRHWGMYWDHQEFGGQYYRPLSAWAIVNGLLGLGIHDGVYEFNPRLPEKNQKLFFAVPDATGHYQRRITGNKETITLTIATGGFTGRQLVFALAGRNRKYQVTGADEARIEVVADKLILSFSQPVRLEAGRKIVVRS